MTCTMRWAAVLLVGLTAACAPERRDGAGGDEVPPSPDAGSVTSDPPDAGARDPACEGVVPKTPIAAPITNGSLAPTAVTLSEGQQLAVGALLFDSWGSWSNGCTGTLVAPKIVLTAGHCVSARRGTLAPADVRFAVGADADSPRAVFDVVAVHRHPQYAASDEDAEHDVAVLVLAAKATDVVPEIVPIAANREALTAALVGANVQVVGYGMTDPYHGDNSKKYWTTELVKSVTTADVVVDGQGRSAVCYGDSGGPLLHTFADGTVRTMGVLSWGDPTCVDVDHFARVDTNVSWVEQPDVAGPLDGDGPGGGTVDPYDCADVTEDGTCRGTVLLRCRNGRLETRDCAGSNDTCGFDSSRRAMCVENRCGSVTAYGTCIGDVALWCENGKIQRFDCGACGWPCADTGAQLGMFCEMF